MISATQIKMVAGLAGVALAAWLAYDYGRTTERAIYEPKLREIAEYASQQAKDIIAERERFDTEMADALQRLEVARNKVRVETVEVEREIIRYRDRPAASDCVLDAEWVRIHDRSAGRTATIAAAANPLPLPRTAGLGAGAGEQAGRPAADAN